jgi:D-glycero-beta-D-manno-heptose-7-phosphate kinase
MSSVDQHLPWNAPSQQLLAQVRVLVAGDVMLDRYWYGAVDRISPEAPVPVVRVQREEARLGAAANVAHNAASLGAQTTLASVLGEDDAGAQLLKLLAANGIASALCQDAALQTTLKLRVIGRQQQLIRLDFEQAPADAALERLGEQVGATLGQHDVLVCSDYLKGSLRDVGRYIEAARVAGLPVLVDPKGRDWARYRGATVVTPNRGELQSVVGDWQDDNQLAQKAQNLRQEFGWDALLLTRSEDGMTLFDQDGALSVGAQAREVFDVTGAGDTVLATLAVLHGAGMPLREAFVHANRAAGIVVGRLGTASVTWAELFGSGVR